MCHLCQDQVNQGILFIMCLVTPAIGIKGIKKHSQPLGLGVDRIQVTDGWRGLKPIIT